jgi:hypothetical protein
MRPLSIAWGDIEVTAAALNHEATRPAAHDNRLTAGERTRTRPRNGDRTIVFHFNHNDTTPRARARWARSIDGLLAESERRPSPLRSIFRRDVVRACAPSLLEVRGVLVDPAAEVRPEAMRRLRDFITDGTRSPLIRGELEPARRVAHEPALTFVTDAESGSTPAAPSSTPEQRVVAAP